MRRILRASISVRRYWYVFRKVTAPPPGELSSEFTCRLVTRADLQALGAFRAHRSLPAFGTWLREHDAWIFVAFDGPRAVAYDCVSRAVPRAQPFARVHLDDADVWVRDEYTLPDYRPRHPMRTLHAYRNAALRELGIGGVVQAVNEDHVGSLAAAYDDTVWKVEGVEYRRVGLMRSVRWHADARPRLHLRLGTRVRAHAAPGGAPSGLQAHA
jgi:hypothetical protein